MTAGPSLAVILALVAGCQAAVADERDPVPEPPRRPTPEAITKLHMRGKLGELRTAEHALVRGKLLDGKVSARAIATAPDEAELADWKRKLANVRQLANEVAEASTTEDALERLPAVAAACAECHVATGGWPKLARAPKVPPDGEGAVPRMARHQWAVDRMWDGMIGGAEDSWRAGLEVLAATPPPYSVVRGDEVALGRELQRTATTALQHRYIDSLDDRAQQYGQLLVTCAACHDTHAKTQPLTPRKSP
jgi:cytochrome c553